MEQPEYQSPKNDDYGEDDVASYDGDLPDADQSATDDVTEDPQSQNLEHMKKRLEELNDEAGALREMQAKVEQISWIFFSFLFKLHQWWFLIFKVGLIPKWYKYHEIYI
ncbi:unnamed protein product [Amaranthus hypochondriacus]